MPNQTRGIGAHVSASGGVEKAMQRVADIGGTVAQVFSGSPRVWKKPSLADIDVDTLYSEMQKNNVESIFTHALYLVNLASNKPDLIQKSLKALRHDLSFDSLIKGSGVVVHLGSHQGRGWDAVREQVAENISALLKDTPDDSRFLIENSAGQKGKLCSELTEIKWLLDTLEAKLGADVVAKRVGWCMDTCHAYCAGYQLATKESEKNEKNSLHQAITQAKLWDSLKLIHVNDAKDPFGSGRDRHQNLGDGEIPTADLKAFLTSKEVGAIPLVLEVPGIDGKGPDAENISRLKKLLA